MSHDRWAGSLKIRHVEGAYRANTEGISRVRGRMFRLGENRQSDREREIFLQMAELGSKPSGERKTAPPRPILKPPRK